MKQLADIGLIVGSIMGAVFFTLLLLSGNTMMQAVRERTSELAVLKTIGFSECQRAGDGARRIGAPARARRRDRPAARSGADPVISAGSGGMLNLPGVGANSWLLGVGLMAAIGLLVGSLPAWSAMRLNIVDALAGR
jgi:putative ABC transport system permease protein